MAAPKPTPKPIEEYHVFLASPGDVNAERQAVREFFEEFNRTIGKPQWAVQFTVIDWENYSTAGIGRPQELINQQTLEKHRKSLALVIGLMGQRFGSKTGKNESGTEEEFEWALNSYLADGFPEIKWFLRRVTKFEAPSDPDKITEATEQWTKVRAFQKKLRDPGERQCYFKEFKNKSDFEKVLRNDLQHWLCAEERQWHPNKRLGVSPPAGEKIVIPLAGSALHQISPPPGDFVGRADEIAELLGQIEKGGVHISGAFGMGGIGKTALALVIADRLKPKYPDAQFYLDLRGAPNPLRLDEKPVAPEEALAHVIRGFHPEAKLPESLAELRGIYLSLLDGKRAIVVMDNARDADQVEPLIPSDGCVLLVTSRNHFHLPGLYSKDLDMMPPEDAKKLLLSICKRIGDQAAEVARRCGYLPLALRVAAGALVERVDLTPEDLVTRLTDATKKGKALAKAYDIAFATSEALLDDGLRGQWRLLSVFPADFDGPAAAAVWAMGNDGPPGDPIRTATVRERTMGGNPPLSPLGKGGGTDRSAVGDRSQSRPSPLPSPLEGEGVEAAQDALGELVRRSLLEFIPSTRRFKLHDLARDYTAARLDAPPTREAKLRHAGYFCALLRFADELYMSGKEIVVAGLALLDRESVNIRAGFGWAKLHVASDHRAAALCNEYPDAGVYVLGLRLHARENIDWLMAALSASRTLKDRAAEGVHLGNLGLAYAALSDARKAIEFHELALGVMRELGNYRAEGSILGNLGIAYAALGDARKAIEYYQQQLAITREIGDRRGEGNTLGNLGNAYYLLGDARKAIEYYEQHHVIAREFGDRHGEGIALGNLGGAYAALGDTHKAFEYHKQALGVMHELGDRRGEGNALGNLGVAYADLGDAHKAIEYYDQQLVITREIGDRRGEGNVLGNLGNAYANLGNVLKAIEYYGQALVIMREIGNRSGEATESWNLGEEYRKQGDQKRAVELMQVYVDYLREIGHADAENRAAVVEELRIQLK